jgi:short-subunit dehydrogenase
METSNKVILITGVSSGFGKACAEFLSQKGYKVYGTFRKPDEETKSYEIIQMDVNNDNSVKLCIRHIIEKEGRIDVVVNNAGFGIAGSIEDTSIEEFKSQFETNLFGALCVCHEVLPIMRNQKSGHIINICSIAGSIGVPFQGAYSASKSALQSLTEVMRMEVKPLGIHVSLIDPGDFKTSLSENRIKTKESQSNPTYTDRFLKALNTMEEEERKGCDPKKLAILVDKIINNPSPRLRYIIGPAMEIFAVRIRKFMPSKLFEKLIMMNYKV